MKKDKYKIMLFILNYFVVNKIINPKASIKNGLDIDIV